MGFRTFIFILLLLQAVSFRSPCKTQLPDWLYESSRWSPPGYHVLCVHSSDRQADDTYKHSGRDIELWINGHAEATPVRWLFTNGTVLAFRRDVQKRAKMKKQKRWRILPWALFTTMGDHVKDSHQLQGLLLAVEGGRWVWPGIREGFERVTALPLPNGSMVNFILKTLTLDPLAFTVDDFLKPQSTKPIISAADPHMKRAGMVLPDNDQGASPDHRTCSEAWVDPRQNPEIDKVAEMAAALARVPRNLQEQFRVLKYERGQHFGAHTDYYEVEHFENQPHIKEALRDGRNWLLTVFLYLQAPKKGGETYFPSTYGRPLPSELEKCDGPSVIPKRGKVLLFYSLNPDSTPNLSSIHGSCKVKKGIKYTANIWMWNQEESPSKPGISGKQPGKRNKMEL